MPRLSVVEFQNRSLIFSRHDLVIGTGYRLTHDKIGNTATVSYDPDERTVHLASAFLQDEISLIPDRLDFTLL